MLIIIKTMEIARSYYYKEFDHAYYDIVNYGYETNLTLDEFRVELLNHDSMIVGNLEIFLSYKGY